jgi:hypothetical protein
MKAFGAVLVTVLIAIAAGVGIVRAVASPVKVVTPSQPGSIAVAPNGGLYIADSGREQILERLPSGSYTVVAGTGVTGLSGDGGPALRAEVDNPSSLLVRDGALYFVQEGLSRATSGPFIGLTGSVIREITPSGTVRTLAGLHPDCPVNETLTSISAGSAWMDSAVLSLGPGAELEVSTNACPNVTDLGPFLRLTATGMLAKGSLDGIGPASVDCSDPTAAPGFTAFVCASGGAAVGYGHPNELLVVRDNGSTTGYPTIGGAEGALVEANGEVVAVHSYAVVRVTSKALTTLVSEGQLNRLFPNSLGVLAINGVAVGPAGDVFLVPDVLRRGAGCLAAIIERSSSGALRKLWSSQPSGFCY